MATLCPDKYISRAIKQPLDEVGRSGTCHGVITEQYEEYVKQVEVKQSDDISGEVEDEKNVDVISRLIYYGVKTICLSK